MWGFKELSALLNTFDIKSMFPSSLGPQIFVANFPHILVGASLPYPHLVHTLLSYTFVNSSFDVKAPIQPYPKLKTS